MRKALLVFVFATVFTGSLGIADSVRAACDTGTKIDKTTVEETRKKIEAAGYRQVHDFRKGCDNYWHAAATKDGKPINVVVSPEGEVMTEGD